MRSYRNKQGELVEVSQEHLDVAVEIKVELQKASPSNRCSWSQHRKLMEKEGFEDSENSEAYRQMIKGYQKSIGELPEAKKYADMVSTSKLASIKEAVGDMNYAKKGMQLQSRKLNKLQKNLTLYGVIAEEIREAMLDELDEQVPTWLITSPRLISSGKRMVVTLSDLHVGAVVVNVNGNSYNYTIAKKRMKQFFNRVVEYAQMLGVTDIDVVVLGDATEHVQMRKTQSHDTEYTLAVQIVKAYELIRDFTVNLTSHFNVTYRGISGNHDRMEGKKEDNIDGDSTIFVINYMMSQFIQDTNAERLQYVEVDSILYSTVIEVNGQLIKFVHGDNEKGNNLLAKHSQMDGVNYSAVVMGHLHHFEVKEVGDNKFEIYMGSLQGNNNYAKKGKFGSGAGQGILVIHEDGEIEPKNIRLQIV
jgi:predicted phosphodiesterase